MKNLLPPYFFNDFLRFLLYFSLLRREFIAGIELVVLAFEGEKFVVGALFDNMAVVEDDDTVGIADGAKAMGDDESGTALH